MSPSEFRAALAALGLPVVGAARVFGVNQRTAQRWASGEQEVPRAVELALTLMVRFKVDPRKL
jgi:pyocin large subunit-like protein